MSIKNNESTDKPNELVFLLAIAGRIDAQVKALAKTLHKNRVIYHTFAITDALSCSFSTFKYLFEVCVSHTNDPQVMHEFLTSPFGAAAVVGECLFIVTFAFLASIFESKKSAQQDDKPPELTDAERIKNFIAEAWPYFRHVLKGMKNSYRAVKCFVQICNLLGVADLKYLIIPLGLVIGVLATLNRFVQQYFTDARKAKNEEYKVLLNKIKLDTIEQIYQEKLDSIKGETTQRLCIVYAARVMGGVFDSLYLYGGLLSLAALVPAAFIAMLALSAFYSLICVISRVYEEYCDQLEREILENRCKLKLEGELLQSKHAKFLSLQTVVELNSEELKQLIQLKEDIRKSIDEFDKIYHILKTKKSSSYISAGLMGVRYGLVAYGVLASFLFMFCALSMTTLPPVFLMACIVSGFIFMLGFSAYTIHAQHHFLKYNPSNNSALDSLSNLKNQIEHDMCNNLLSTQEFKSVIIQGMVIEEAPTFLFQEWMEILRTLFSGLSKGNSFLNFVTVPIQDPDQQMPDRDSPWIIMFLVIHSAVFALVLSVRALTKGLKPKSSEDSEDKPPPAQVADASKAGDPGKETKTPCLTPSSPSTTDSSCTTPKMTLSSSSTVSDAPPAKKLLRDSSLHTWFGIIRSPSPDPLPLSKDSVITIGNTAGGLC